MPPRAIFGPVFATVFLTFIVWVYMYVRRTGFINGRPERIIDDIQQAAGATV